MQGQTAGVNVIRQAKAIKIKNLEKELREVVLSHQEGDLFQCPFCKYIGKKNKKGTAKIFRNSDGLAFKCFNCGRWRKIKNG